MPEPVETPELPPDIIDLQIPAVPQIHAPEGQLTAAAGTFVKYVAEDEHAYQVRTRSQGLIEVAKGRSPGAAFPPARPSPLRPAYRWLALATAGLVFSGVGALLLAPLAGLSALHVQRERLSPTDEARARLIVFLAGLLMALGAGLAYLFWMHLRG